MIGKVGLSTQAEFSQSHREYLLSAPPNKWMSDGMANHLFRVRHDETVSVLATGDSSVFGVGDFGDRLPSVGAGWTGRFAHDINAKRYINVARNGARARHLNESQLKAALGMRPTLVLTCIGTNDVLRGDYSPTEIEESLQNFVRRLHEIGSIAIFLGLPDPLVTAPGPLALRRILNRRVKAVNEILYRVARREDAIFIATWQLPYDRRNWHVDRMHPSPSGHQVIAQHVRRELALIRKCRDNLPIDVERSKHFETYWLMTNGLKWFLKRSIDLIPGLLWLIASDWLAGRARSQQPS